MVITIVCEGLEKKKEKDGGGVRWAVSTGTAVKKCNGLMEDKKSGGAGKYLKGFPLYVLRSRTRHPEMHITYR